MKYTLIIIASFVVIFAACQKKSTMTSCYKCYNFDSTYSNVSGLIPTDSVLLMGSDSICNQTADRIAFIKRSNDKTDTSYKNAAKDTFVIHHHYYQCNQQ